MVVNLQWLLEGLYKAEITALYNANQLWKRSLAQYCGMWVLASIRVKRVAIKCVTLRLSSQLSMDLGKVILKPRL